MWETLTMPLPVFGGEGGGGQPAIKQPGCRNVRTWRWHLKKSFHFLICPSETFLDIELLKEHRKKKKIVTRAVRLRFCSTNSAEDFWEGIYSSEFLLKVCCWWRSSEIPPVPYGHLAFERCFRSWRGRRRWEVADWTCAETFFFPFNVRNFSLPNAFLIMKQS